jgi:hypothetical protein
MADKTPSQYAAETLRVIADIEKELGELSVTVTAELSALRDLFPEFEARFVAHLEDRRSLQLKSEFEQKIRVLLEGADRMSKI